MRKSARSCKLVNYSDQNFAEVLPIPTQADTNQCSMTPISIAGGPSEATGDADTTPKGRSSEIPQDRHDVANALIMMSATATTTTTTPRPENQDIVSASTNKAPDLPATVVGKGREDNQSAGRDTDTVHYPTVGMAVAARPSSLFDNQIDYSLYTAQSQDDTDGVSRRTIRLSF